MNLPKTLDIVITPEFAKGKPFTDVFSCPLASYVTLLFNTESCSIVAGPGGFNIGDSPKTRYTNAYTLDQPFMYEDYEAVMGGSTFTTKARLTMENGKLTSKGKQHATSWLYS